MADDISERAYRWPRRYVFAMTLLAIAALLWWLLA
jgi:hypothetical protein